MDNIVVIENLLRTFSITTYIPMFLDLNERALKLVKIRLGNLQNCEEAADLVVAIDVIRAFSTAAFAFDRGAEKIICTDEVDQAFQIAKATPNSLIMGEIDGISIPGFDLNNSTSKIAVMDLSGKTIVQRTTAGTPGLVRPTKAKVFLACGLLNVGATAAYIRSLQPEEVFLVATGTRTEELERGDEDVACAEYIRGLLTGKPFPLSEVIPRVRNSVDAALFSDPNSDDFPLADLDLTCQVDRFDFVMRAERLTPHSVMLRKIPFSKMFQ